MAQILLRHEGIGAKKVMPHSKALKDILSLFRATRLTDGYSAHRRTTMDDRLPLHRRWTSTASHHVLRGRPSCPLRSEKRRGAEKTGSTMLHGLQGLLLYSAHRRTTIDARSLLHRRRTSTASHHVLRGRPSCPLRSEKRRGAEKTGSTMLHGLQGLLL